MIKVSPTPLSSYGSWLKFAQALRRDHFLNKGGIIATNKKAIATEVLRKAELESKVI